jgi:hypothetical protein
MNRSSSVQVVLMIGVLAGCDCTRGAGIRASPGELALVWQDALGNQNVDRNAFYDFGFALVGDRRQAVIVAKNVGSGRLEVSTLDTESGDAVSISPQHVDPQAAFSLEFEPATLGSSEEKSYLVTFEPKKGRSVYFAKLKMSAEGATEETGTAFITLQAKGDVGSCVLPKVIDLGNVPVGETFTIPFTFKNTTEESAEATLGNFEGLDAAAFGFGRGTMPGKIAVSAKGESVVNFTFSPTEMRAYETTIKLAGPAPSCETVTVTVKGTGVDTVLTWAPTQLRFGLVAPTFEKQMDVTFTNTSMASLELTNVTVSNDKEFAHRVPMGADATKLVLAPNQTTQMKVACTPTSLGARSGTLTFETPVKKTPQGTISLDCTGGGPKIRVTPRPTIAFGPVPFIQGSAVPATRKISVQNVGAAPAMIDPSFHLFLGKVDAMGMPGQMPHFEVRPTNADTMPGEFTLALVSSYDSRTGLRPVAGQNEVTLQLGLLPRTTGMKAAEVLIYSNDGSEPVVTVQVTAQAQLLPPCNYRVTPQLANFGIVPAGTSKDLPITITNQGNGRQDVCFLSNFAFAAGTDAAYSFVGSVPMEKELRPQESWPLVVRVAPKGPAPTTLTTLAGAVTFDVTNPTNPQGRIDLRTSVGPSCLTATPDPLDFGTVRTAPPPSMRCSSPSKTVTIYNTCSSPLTIRQIALQAAAGQQAGGPQCPGGQSCPEFFLTQAPTVPATGLPLSQGAAPLTLQVRYSPLDFGNDSGAIGLEVDQNGQRVQYLVALAGRGDLVGRQTDTFMQDRQPRADILLVIDNSGSMANHQASLANNFTSFIQYAQSARVDYQIGVVTTDNGNLRATTSGTRFLSNTSPNLQTAFSSLVQVGTSGSATERPLEFATAAVTPPLVASSNAGFVRPDANLAVVIVTDTEDQSSQAASYYENLLINVKGFGRLSNFTFSVVGPFAPSPPTGCAYDNILGQQARYTSLIQRTSGVKEEICSANWSTALQGLGRTAFGFRTQFFLTNAPDLTGGQTINVLINGQPAPPSTYMYEAASNSIRFTPNTTPQPGQTLTIDYATACL